MPQRNEEHPPGARRPRELLVTYAKQEIVEPLKSLGRFLGFGVAGSVLLGLGAVLLTLAVLRALQTETGTTFTGNWSWAPYLIVLVADLVAAVLLALRIPESARRSGDGRTPRRAHHARRHRGQVPRAPGRGRHRGGLGQELRSWSRAPSPASRCSASSSSSASGGARRRARSSRSNGCDQAPPPAGVPARRGRHEPGVARRVGSRVRPADAAQGHRPHREGGVQRGAATGRGDRHRPRARHRERSAPST